MGLLATIGVPGPWPGSSGRPAGGAATPRYLIIVEEWPNHCSACSPQVPGCIATGKTRQEAIERMRGAIAFHLEGLRADGDPLPDGLRDDAVAESVDLA